MKYEIPKTHGHCPECGVSLDGSGIWQHFYDQFTTTGYWICEEGNYSKVLRILEHYEAEERADSVAGMYGASRTKGRWGRAVGIEYDRDRVEEWQCPDCNHRWARC